MGKTKHTPGPWIIGNVNERCHEVDNVDGWPVAEVFGAANAQLIAAAPDLLDALKQMLFNAEHGNGTEAHYKVNDRARAAISKAEGDTDE